ncbi:MAG TPA: O-antigen ligase family protein [Gemmataceae bacterium]|nr:O-antigen ligase family protein [Gemmataceae bacterium]
MNRWVEAGRWVLLLHLVLAPLVFSTWTADAFEGPKALLLTASALVLSGLAVCDWLARGAPFRWPARPDLATFGMLLLAASAVLSTVMSINPLLSWRGAPDSHAGLQTLLSYLVLYLSARAWYRAVADGRRLLTAVVVGSALSAAYAVIQAVGLDPILWDGVSLFADRARPFGMFGHPNYLAAYLVMTGPPIALFVRDAVQRRRWGTALILTAIAGLGAAAVAAALSRAAWLAGGAALLVLGGGWFLAGRRRSALVLAGLAIVAAAGFCGWAAIGSSGAGLAGNVAQRLGRIGDGEGRWQIWHAAADLFRDRPVAGWGTDAFQVVFGRRRPADYADAEWNVTPTRAHNVVLHLLATQGLLGGAAAAGLAVGLVLAGVRAWRRSSPDERPLIAAVGAGLTAFLVQDLFGFTVIGCGSLFVVAAGLLSRWGYARSEEEPQGGKSIGALSGLSAAAGAAVVLFGVNVGWAGMGATAALGVTAALAVLAVWRMEGDNCELRPNGGEKPRRSPGWGPAACIGVALATAAALYFAVIRPLQAEIARGAGDRIVAAAPAEALTHYRCAVQLDPDDDRGWTQLSAAAQLSARQTAALEERRRLLDEAHAALDRALALGPAIPSRHANLGRLLGEMAAQGLARGDDAVVQWDAALTDDPLNPLFLAEAARTALAVGRFDRARRWLARGLELYPNYALLYHQQGACDLADGRLDDAAAALEHALHADWHGDEEDFTRAIATYAAVQLSRRQFDQARQLAAEAERRDSRWATPCLLKARALLALGRREEARDVYRRVLRLNPADAEAQAALLPPAPKP